jgi:hypothetical protein
MLVLIWPQHGRMEGGGRPGDGRGLDRELDCASRLCCLPGGWELGMLPNASLAFSPIDPVNTTLYLARPSSTQLQCTLTR